MNAAPKIDAVARDERLGLRLSADELAMAHALASADGLTVSDVFRLTMRRAYVERFGTAPPKATTKPTKRGK